MTRSGARASAWSALDLVLSQGLQFLVSIVLARLLTPEDFGVIALLTFFTSLSVVFLQGGFSIALIQKQTTTREEESVLFWWNLAASTVLGTALIIGGRAIAEFFNQPVLAMLTLPAAAQLIFSALGAVPTALLMRQMRFDVLAKTGAFAALVGGILAIMAAASGLGVWALAIQGLAFAMLSSGSVWFISRWLPAAHFRVDTARSLFRFGAWVSIVNVADVLYTHGSALLIGKLHGVRDLGFYNRAAATQALPSVGLSAIIARVALPLLSAKQHDPDAARSSLRLTIRTVMLINLPVMTGLFLLSDLVIIVLFGERWLPAIPILSILALAGVLLPMHVLNLQLILSRGDSRTYVRNEIAKKTLGIICVIIGSLFGVIGLAWGQVVYSALGFFMNANPARRALNYGPLKQLRDLGGIYVATLVLAGAVLALRAVLRTGPYLTLGICVLAGGAVYMAVGWLAGLRAFRDALDMLKEEFTVTRQNRSQAAK